mmetsp:Transcript_31855/g.71703  ORF Transcript_31855/g.71703 Transcript_31855/m.71703 type:complete len:360 (+) Transcript_31855:219-1298(+)
MLPMSLQPPSRGKVAFGVLAGLYLLDSPRLRLFLEPSLWAPFALAGSVWLRARPGTGAGRSILGLLSSEVGVLGGDLLGLVLLCDLLRKALALRRGASVWLGSLLSPPAWPNSPRRSFQSATKALQKAAVAVAMKVASRTPGLAGILQAEIDKEVTKMEADLLREMRPAGRDARSTMPEKGLPASEIKAMVKAFAAKEDKTWEDGRVSGAVYHGGAEHLALLNECYAATSVCNPLHPDIWPSSIKFESEVVKWVADLVRGGDPDVCGAVTSGGTESIILAAKAHRDRALSRGVSRPEMVACVTAHAAIDKACDLMGLRLVKLPMTDDYVLDLGALQAAINADTCMVYASAPSFPQVQTH